MNEMTILVANADANPLLRDLIEQALQKDVVAASISLTEAREKLKDNTNPPEAIFVANPNEEEVTSLLRLITELGLQHSVSVFVFLNSENESEVERYLSLGAADVITAATRPEAVVERVNLITPVFTSHFGTDIDITPKEAPTAASGIKVFVVEDDSLLKNLLEAKLTNSNIDCQFAKKFDDVLTEMKAFNPDVAVLDIMLPEKNGLDILESIKGDEELKSIKTLIFSNRDEQADRTRATELGADGYFVKAMTDLSDLVKTIESLA